MLTYEPLAYRPFAAPPPALGRYNVRSPVLAQTFDELLGWPAWTGDVLRLTFHGATTWLGAKVALENKGWMRTIGWILAVGNGIAGVCDAISLVKRATGTHPPSTPAR